MLTWPLVREIEAERAGHITTPFPDAGSAYEQVVRRVAAWLDDVVRDYARQTALVVGHRATFYALQHLINTVPLRDAVPARAMAVASRDGSYLCRSQASCNARSGDCAACSNRPI